MMSDKKTDKLAEIEERWCCNSFDPLTGKGQEYADISYLTFEVKRLRELSQGTENELYDVHCELTAARKETARLRSDLERLRIAALGVLRFKGCSCLGPGDECGWCYHVNPLRQALSEAEGGDA